MWSALPLHTGYLCIYLFLITYKITNCACSTLQKFCITDINQLLNWYLMQKTISRK